MTLGKKLANYRKLAGLTQQQLGEKLNISPQAISKWENDLAEPDLSTIRALSKLYNISIVELIEQENEISLPVIQESQGIDEEELKEEIKEDIKENIKDIKEDVKEGIKEEIQEIIGFCKKAKSDFRLISPFIFPFILPYIPAPRLQHAARYRKYRATFRSLRFLFRGLPRQRSLRLSL